MAGGLALALSGGGARGAFQVGVLDELINVHGVDFETVTGTSTGAIQAAAVAQGDVPGMVAVWMGIKGNSSIYKGRGGPVWAILTGKDSLYSTGPLRKLLFDFYDDDIIRNSGKELRIAVVNPVDGELRTIDQNTPNIANWVYASAAQPPFFPPVPIREPDGSTIRWLDGGIRDVTPYAAALKLAPRAVLVVRALAPLAAQPGKYNDILEIGLRSVALLTEEVANSDLGNVESINRLLKAAETQRATLVQMGLTPEQVDEAMAPLTSELEGLNFAPTLVLQPPDELYGEIEFDPDLIPVNIERGREMVRSRWSEIAAFLGVPE